MATLKTIQRELIKLKAVYPHPDRSALEIKILAEIWMEDFEGIRDADLQDAIRQHRKISQYFPGPADLLKQIHEARNRMKAIPEHTKIDDAQIERNKGHIKTLIKRIGGDIVEFPNREARRGKG